MDSKEQWLEKVFAQYHDQLQSIQSADSDWHYRDKVSLRASYSIEEKRWHFGLIQDEEFLAIDECPLHTGRIIKLFSLLAKFPPPEQIPLCHVQISGRQMVLIIKKHWDEKAQAETQLKALAIDGFFAQFDLDGIWVNYNPEPGRWLTRRRTWFHLWGKETSYSVEGSFHYHPGAFGQLNYSLHQRSLEFARNFFQAGGGSEAAVVDFYCGIGLSCRHWNSFTAQLLAIELDQFAVSMARLNVPELDLLQGMGKHRLPQVREWTQNQKQLFCYLNPPRLGLEPEVLEWLVSEEKIKKIAYLSCSPRTLVRDLELLQKKFVLKELIPFDFFPKTRHIENLALLEKET